MLMLIFYHLLYLLFLVILLIWILMKKSTKSLPPPCSKLQIMINTKLIVAESQKDPTLASLIVILSLQKWMSRLTLLLMTSFLKGIKSSFVSPYSSLSGTSLCILERYRCWYWEIFKILCRMCTWKKTIHRKVPVHPWDTPANNWDRILINYGGPYQNCHFLVIADSISKWCEVRVPLQLPTTHLTIQLLDKIFAFHGFPLSIVSDNAIIFVNNIFKQYYVCNSIWQKLIALDHPVTNGLAKRNVQTLKQQLWVMSNNATPLYEKVRKILFWYEATPLSCGKSFTELYLGRQLSTCLDVVFPMPPEPFLNLLQHALITQGRGFKSESFKEIRTFEWRGNKNIGNMTLHCSTRIRPIY